jgi:hypothetical protein
MQRFPHSSGLEDTPIGQLYQRHWHALFTVIRQSISSRERTASGSLAAARRLQQVYGFSPAYDSAS